MFLIPNKHRLRLLNLSGFKIGEQVLFCPDCDWQADQPLAMKPVCPKCNASLHVSRIDEELVELIENKIEDISCES